jgi:hypothetical protein
LIEGRVNGVEVPFSVFVLLVETVGREVGLKDGMTRLGLEAEELLVLLSGLGKGGAEIVGPCGYEDGPVKAVRLNVV